MVYPIARRIFPLIMKIWLKNVHGTQNIPSGPFVACMNHASFVDDIVIPSTIVPKTKKYMHMYVNRNYFKNFWLRSFLAWGGSIPVEVHDTPNKREINKKASETALNHLKKGESIGIYPEGKRTDDGELNQGKPGAANLAITATVPILPIAIEGSREVLRKGAKFPKLKKCISITIGKPISLEEFHNTKITQQTLDTVTRKVMKSIAKMLNKEYRY